MSNGYLTTHVLDVFNGTPGRGIRGKIFRIEKEKKEKSVTIRELSLEKQSFLKLDKAIEYIKKKI